MRTFNRVVAFGVVLLFLMFGLISNVMGDTFLPYNQSDVLQAVNVQGAWSLGYKGKGVIVGVMDQGVQYNHSAFSNSSFDSKLSYNFGSYYGDSTKYGSETDYAPWWDNYMYNGKLYYGDNHGTNVASCINSQGELSPGIAPDATTASLRIDLVVSAPTGKSQQVMINKALDYENGTIQIKNGSYGMSVGYIPDSATQSIVNGTAAGTVYVFSAGNERDDSDFNCKDCNKKATQANPHSITVAATGQVDWNNGKFDFTKASDFSCYGSNVFVTAPGYVVTADRTDDSATKHYANSSGTAASYQGYQGDADDEWPYSFFYDNGHHDGTTNRTQGTSFSAPIVSASLAIATQALAANPKNTETTTIPLSTRLMKHLLVQTSTKIDTAASADETKWTTNAAGNAFSASYGFGQVNVTKLTNAALTTNGVTEQTLACASWGDNFSIGGDTQNITISEVASKENLVYGGIGYYTYTTGSGYTFEQVETGTNALYTFKSMSSTDSFTNSSTNTYSNNVLTSLNAGTDLTTTIKANFDASIFNTAATSVQGLEEVTLSLSTLIMDNLNDLRIELTSPQGTTSILAYADSKSEVYSDVNGLKSWTFTSNAFWGEKPEGDWTLSIIDTNGDNNTETTIRYIGNITTTFYMGELKPLDILQYNAADSEDLGKAWNLNGEAGGYNGVNLKTGTDTEIVHEKELTISAPATFNVGLGYSLEQTGDIELENNPNIDIDGGGTLIFNLGSTTLDTSKLGAITLSSDSILEFDTTTSQTLAFTTSGNGSLSGAGSLVLQGNKTTDSSYDLSNADLSGLDGALYIHGSSVTIGQNSVVNTICLYDDSELKISCNVLNSSMQIMVTGSGIDKMGAIRQAANCSGLIAVMGDTTIGIDANCSNSAIIMSVVDGTSTLTIQSNTASACSTFKNVLADSSSWLYAYYGAQGTMNVDVKSGTHTFSGDMEYAGTTTVEKNAEMILSGEYSNLKCSQVVTVDGTLDFTDYSGSSDMQLNNLSGSGAIKGTDKDLVLYSDTDNPQVFDGTIDIGTATLYKDGEGRVKLWANSYASIKSESIVVNAGRLDMKEFYKGNIDVEADAQLSPGNSIGALTVDGNLILETGAKLVMEIGKKDADSLTIIGDLLDEKGNLPSSKSIFLVMAEGENLDPNTPVSFTLKANNLDESTDWSKLIDSGAFNVTPTKDASGNWFFSGTYIGTPGVPEPSTWALLILGSAGLLWLRKKNSK